MRERPCSSVIKAIGMEITKSLEIILPLYALVMFAQIDFDLVLVCSFNPLFTLLE